MATKSNKTVKVEDSKSYKFENVISKQEIVIKAASEKEARAIVDKEYSTLASRLQFKREVLSTDFDAPVMDDRIVKLNELKSVKMSNITPKKRPSAREAKELASFILKNWDDENALSLLSANHDVTEISPEDFLGIQTILDSRLKNFADAKKACEEAAKETDKKETKKRVFVKETKADSKKEEPKAKEEVKKETKPAKTARKVGDVHPNHPTWIWTEYAEGKFDWRTNPADKKQGQRTDKATTSAKKSEPKKKAAKKETKPVKEEKKELTIEEFVALPKTTKSNKKPSEAQAKALKLINKGYRITADKNFFEKDDSREACNWDSVVALFRRYGIEYIPEGLVKSL